MFNVTVIDGKKLVKCISLIATVIIMAIFIKQINSKNQNNVKEVVEEATQELYSHSYLSSVDLNIAALKYINASEEKNNKKNESFISNVLNSELGVNNKIIKKSIDDIIEDDIVEIENNLEVIDAEIPENITTQVVEENNIKATYTNTYENVEIKNKTSYELDPDILNPDISLENKKDIIIYHTHTCESYTPTENFNYQMTGTYRTTDLNYSVARVGNNLTDILKEKGYDVVHNTTLHDFPAYTGSYDRSYETVTSILKDKKDTQLIIDIHRDAIGNGAEYGPTVKINDETVAQLMIVIGTDAGGLKHSNWKENLKFAVKLQAKANEMYPGLFRPINVSTARYNQHLSKGAMIIEVGATGNTMEQSLGSMKYLASVIDEVMKTE